ncbi:hypothetical protein ABEV55_13735 [Aneurinibacillus thermoaerophilus]|uniref:hypothetical protein n=1 Tax=Aneurinibacillus thermoaerophilus TaxID=143495 RepID=UPI002E239B8D|nr:hypothetical protein [Aneurinibacillus thermoaerophilus]
MKKVLISFFTLYLLGGIVYFLWNSTEKKPTEPRTQATSDYNKKTEIEWNVNNSKKGNYIPPDYHQRDHYTEKEAELHYHEELESPTIPNDRLMNLFDLAQRGPANELSGMINPNIVHKDFQKINNPDTIDQKLKQYASLISRNATIKNVKISKPKLLEENRASYDVTVEYEDGKVLTLTNMTMVRVGTADVNWYLDMTLNELINRIQTEASS